MRIVCLIWFGIPSYCFYSIERIFFCGVDFLSTGSKWLKGTYRTGMKFLKKRQTLRIYSIHSDFQCKAIKGTTINSNSNCHSWVTWFLFHFLFSLFRIHLRYDIYFLYAIVNDISILSIEIKQKKHQRGNDEYSSYKSTSMKWRCMVWPSAR
jgi:hypothetical protein